MGELMDATPVRSLVLWIPDWPVVALTREAALQVGREEPVAVVGANTVIACSAAARTEGVRRGQRRRDAQSRCPRLRIVPADDARDRRLFDPVVARIEEAAPGVQPIRPGLCALRARGPARYYGGEEPAAHTLIARLAELGVPDVRAGIADGPFTAEQVARTAPAGDVRSVPAGAAAVFLAPLPVAVLEAPELAELLTRLGVHTLGAFAALDADRVLDRFGPVGARLHALAAGRDSRPVQPRIPPPELAREIAFEPPLDLVDQVASPCASPPTTSLRGSAPKGSCALSCECASRRIGGWAPSVCGCTPVRSTRPPSSTGCAGRCSRWAQSAPSGRTRTRLSKGRGPSPGCGSCPRRSTRHPATDRRSSVPAATSACTTPSRACRRCSGTAGC
ncbi:MAG: hypothetical protein ACK5IN_03870 [Microbacterium sp.]|uniref:DNA polymerase Y family protein n=1 Tax=Microbacterium sp. TaxID=51671 RepID=UPI003A86C226